MVRDIYEIQPDREMAIRGGYKIIAYAIGGSKPNVINKNLPKYDIAVYDKEGERIFSNSGCLGNSALEYWWNYNVNRTRKLAILTEDLQMAEHNMHCYSKYAGCEEDLKEELARVELLNEWIDKIKTGTL